MASDLFFFSSLEARSLSFPCCNQSLFCRFRLSPLPFHTLRLSASNHKFSHQFVSKCSNSSSDSASGDFGIVSTTECPDGSIIFHFGNSKEIAIKKTEQSHPTGENDKVVVEDSDKEQMSSIDVVDVSDEEPQVGEPASKKVGRNLKLKSQPKRKRRQNTTGVVDIVKDKTASVVTHTKEGSVDLDNVGQVGNNSVPEGNGEGISKIEGATNLNMVLDKDLAPDVENASPPLTDSGVETEITTQLASSELGSKIEVPHTVRPQEENSDASEVNSGNVGKIEGTTSKMVSKVDFLPDIEKVSSALSAPAIENGIKSEQACLESDAKSEVHQCVDLQEGNSGASDGNGESFVKIEGATLNTKSQIDLAVEVDHPQVAASKNNSESEIIPQSISLEACSNIEVPYSLKFQESGKDDAGEEVAHLSVPSKEDTEEDNINASKVIQHANEGDVGEVKPNSTLYEIESILNEATSHKTLDDSIDDDIVKSSKLSDVGVPFSFFKEEITEADSQSGNKIRVPMLKGAELQSGGTTLEREEISTAGFFLYSGAALLPNPAKAFAGGEDAYFIACQKWLGVADGVGQWSLEGISVGLYAKELMGNCEKIVSDRNGVQISDPVEVLNGGAVNTQSCGSSTVLVAYFDDQALHVANIGDSGFMIIRNGDVFKRSSPMLYEFNFPVQIERGDHPSDFAQVYRVDLNEGDVIITATDGLFDNLYEHDIVSIVLKSLKESLRPQEIAELLATRAQEVGQLSSVRSPFADEAQAAGYVGYRGGKLDDVAVIVSLVKRLFSNHVQ
ncbi:hypothetical protein DITRI_Ditri08aG0086100 [Diplodiscus trichospermus]